MASISSSYATPINAAAPIIHPLNKTKSAKLAPKVNHNNIVLGTTTPIISNGITMSPHPALKKLDRTKVAAASTEDNNTLPISDKSFGAKDVTVIVNIFNGLDNPLTFELSKNWSGTFRGSVPEPIYPGRQFAGSFVHTKRENLNEGSIAALMYCVKVDDKEHIWLFAWAVAYPKRHGSLNYPNHVYSEIREADSHIDKKDINWREIRDLLYKSGPTCEISSPELDVKVEVGRGPNPRLDASIMISDPLKHIN